MLPLPQISKKWGSLWILIDRTDDYALLEQKFELSTKNEESEYISRFNVIKVIKAPEATIGGNLILAKEKIPADSQWGVYGWTYLTKDLAQAKFDELKKQKS